jgi:hypothetical protein
MNSVIISVLAILFLLGIATEWDRRRKRDD